MSVCDSDGARPPLRIPAFVQDDLRHLRGGASVRVLPTSSDEQPACLEYAPLECRKTPDVCITLPSTHAHSL